MCTPWGCVLALAGTDVYRACVHTSGVCTVVMDRRERVQSVFAPPGVCAGVGGDRCVQSVCAHLGVCTGIGMDRHERVQSMGAHLGVCAYVVL